MLTKPSWITISQSSINLSGFNKDLTWSQVIPKPSWITTSQSSINLSGFNNNLLGALWADVHNRPLWTEHFKFSQGILFNGIYLLQQIVNRNNFIPDTNGIHYLGSPALRYAGVYSDAFHGVDVAPFDASLKPDIVPAARRGLADIDDLRQVVDLTWKADDN